MHSAVLPRELVVWRVICADGHAGRPLSVAAPYVGREEELQLLENAYARAVRDRSAQLVTIYGEPGIGKSRLAREFFAGLERTTVLTGRSLPFGEGLAYRPLAVLSIDLDLAGDYPLVRDRFLFGPNTRVFSIPSAGFSARLGLSAVWR